jgi:Carboxypeptidase regulatory-like domain
MSEPWRDINDPGFFRPAKQVDKKPPAPYLTDTVQTEQEDESPEVKLSNAVFIKGDEGFAFNKKCGAQVDVEFLKPTARKKVTFKLFSVYKDEEQDMHCQAEGFEQGGIAKADLTLFYNDTHYGDYCNDPSITLDYFFRASHSTGNEVESPHLTMPSASKQAHRARLVGMLFDANKCFLLPQGLDGIKTVVSIHKEFPDAKVLIVGHAGGDEDLAGLDMALDRAEMLSAFLTNKSDLWLEWFSSKKETRVRWGTREVQLMLSVLPEGQKPFYAGIAPGITDKATTQAIMDFQKFSNENKGANLTVDGKAGPETRKALVEAYMNLEDTSLSADIVPVTHGCEGHFDDTATEDGLQPDDRRIEVFFFEKDIDPEPSAETTSAGSTEYPAWLEQVIDTKDFEHHGINVQIVDSTNQPVPQATVTLEGPTSHEASTDDHGYVSFSGLKAGEYTIHSEKKDYKIGDSKLTYPTAKTVPGSVKSPVAKMTA